MFGISERLVENCRKTPERMVWLGRLPATVQELEQRWSLTLGKPFDGPEVSCAWVANVTMPDATSAVLKVGMPHMEGKNEIDGLRYWNGDPTVRLLNADENLGAMILEHCDPGTSLRTIPEPEQDAVIADLLHRLWSSPSVPHLFRPLSDLTSHWRTETLTDMKHWVDAGLVRGLRLFEELSQNSSAAVLLATDLHAGNVLQSRRKPWLVIDPKPFVGDPAYDATQHLFNCVARLRSNPYETIARFADLLGVDRERVRLWMFARAAAEPRDDWSNGDFIALARTLS
jgi:streptomycin 6-kinase